jgi:hypothetical protein
VASTLDDGPKKLTDENLEAVIKLVAEATVAVAMPKAHLTETDIAEIVDRTKEKLGLKQPFRKAPPSIGEVDFETVFSALSAAASRAAKVARDKGLPLAGR